MRANSFTGLIRTDIHTPGFGQLPGLELKKYPRVTGFRLNPPGLEIYGGAGGEAPREKNFAFLLTFPLKLFKKKHDVLEANSTQIFVLFQAE